MAVTELLPDVSECDREEESAEERVAAERGDLQTGMQFGISHKQPYGKQQPE